MLTINDIVDKVYSKLKDHLKSPVVAIVDFTKPSNERRLTIKNMNNDEILLETYVTHGSGSGQLYATTFSNITNSHQSSIGVFKTGETYIGKHGVSCKLDGLDIGFNDKARSRSIVIHSANYIGDGKTGRSWGCFAVPTALIKTVLDLLKDGHLLIAYYPDKNWLNTSKWLR